MFEPNGQTICLQKNQIKIIQWKEKNQVKDIPVLYRLNIHVAFRSNIESRDIIQPMRWGEVHIGYPCFVQTEYTCSI